MSGRLPFWGYSHDDIVTALYEEIVKPMDGSKHNIYLVGHDWGAATTHAFLTKYPTSVTKSILLDAGQIKLSEMNIKSKLIMLGYQLYLSLMFLVWRLLSCVLGGTVSDGICMILLVLYPWKFLAPTNHTVCLIIFLYNFPSHQ